MSASRTIHALVARIGMADEDYRAMLWDRFHANSSKDLNTRQSLELVASLHQLLPAEERAKHPRPQIAAGTRRRFDSLGTREGMATPTQLRMLEASFVQRSRAETLPEKQEAFRVFLRNRCKVERIEWIQRGQVGPILRAIQSVDPDAPPRRKRTSKPRQTHMKGA